MKIKVVKTSGRDWYSQAIGRVFNVEREAKDFYLVRRYRKWEQVDKKHAEVVG